jgi:hypothetical protein
LNGSLLIEGRLSWAVAPSYNNELYMPMTYSD